MDSHIAPVEPMKAYRLINHGPTVLVSARHDGVEDVMAAAWSCALDFQQPKLTVVLDKTTRTRELIEAPWSEFDLDRARWDIPKERMKMRTPHIVPLSRQAVEILRSLHRLSGHCELVFPGRDPKKSMSNMTILKGLERMGYKGKQTGHGFRRSLSSSLG